MTGSRENQNPKKKRQLNKYESVKHKYYIFCEGEKTEKLYFSSFRKTIEKNALYKNMVLIEVEGCGVETLRVVAAAEEYVEKNKIKSGQVWCVYDKDDFPAEHFNAVAQRINILNKNVENLSYHEAWSNQCFEYWFVLHFANYVADNDRSFYLQFLDTQLERVGMSKYDKCEMFDKLLSCGNPKNAIKYAKKQIESHKGKTDSESAPATKVHLLVEELTQYLPEETRIFFV